MRFFFSRSISIFLALLFLKNVFAQTIISGHIRNKQGDAISFATVKLKFDATVPQALTYTIATIDGHFSFICPAEIKTGFLEVTAIGYQLLQIYLTKIEGHEIKIYPVLEQSVKPLPGIYLKADPPIHISGDTISFKVNAFKNGDEKNISRLLSKMPGFSLLENGKIAFNGEPIAKILIDNDDLTGTHYEGLIKYLSISGIEKIQIFKNYKDPENIASSILNSNIQVLNIKYAERFKGKLLGNIEISIGIPPKYYDENGQFLSLVPKAKVFGILKMNSVGELSNNNYGSKNPDNYAQEITDISLSDNKSLSEITDINISHLSQQPLKDNNSMHGLINYYFRPNKKLIIKGATNILNDTYSQRININNTILTISQPILQIQETDIFKKNTYVSQTLSGNYIFNGKNQVTAVIKFQNFRLNSLDSGLINNKSYKEGLTGSNNQFNYKFTYNYIFTTNSILTFVFQHKKNSIPNKYYLKPSNYDTLFNPSTLYQFNEQNESQTFSKFYSSLSFVKKNMRNSLFINLFVFNNTTLLSNILSVYNSADNKHKINPDSTNDLRLQENQLSVKIQDTWKYNSQLSFSLGSGFSLQAHEIINKEINSVIQSVKKFSVLPEISAIFELKKLNRISLTYHMQSSAPALRYLANGYILTNYTGIYKGFDTLQIAPSTSLQFSFSHLDILNKGLLLFAGIHYLRSPLFLLPDQYFYSDYTFSQ